MQVHRPATIECSYCYKRFGSHSDLFRHLEVACEWTNQNYIHRQLLEMNSDESCASPYYLRKSRRYFCRDCERTFNDMGSLAAHIEHSGSCPASV